MRTGTFRLTKSLKAVKFDENGKGIMVELPVGADVRILGTSTIKGCLEILCDEERYNVFEKDLMSNSTARPRSLSAEA